MNVCRLLIGNINARTDSTNVNLTIDASLFLLVNVCRLLIGYIDDRTGATNENGSGRGVPVWLGVVYSVALVTMLQVVSLLYQVQTHHTVILSLNLKQALLYLIYKKVNTVRTIDSKLCFTISFRKKKQYNYKVNIKRYVTKH